jgi:hypothetical protein
MENSNPTTAADLVGVMLTSTLLTETLVCSVKDFGTLKRAVSSSVVANKARSGPPLVDAKGKGGEYVKATPPPAHKETTLLASFPHLDKT